MRDRYLMHLQRCGRGLLAGVFCFAGLGKLLNLETFRQAIEAWTIVPDASRYLVSYLIPIAEATVGLVFFLGLTWRIVRFPLAALVFGLTGAYLVQISIGPPPPCECWGVWADYVGLRQTVTEKLITAAGMVTLLLACWSDRPARSRAGTEPTSPGDRAAVTRAGGPVMGANARAFSLVELLVVIAIIAVLIGLALPLVRQVRAKGDLTAQLAKLGEHARIMHVYAGDYKDTWPTVDPRGVDGMTTWEVPGWPTLGTHYFGLAAGWPKLLFANYYDGDPFHPSFKALRRSKPPITSFYLSQALWADPEFWRPETRTGPEQWRATRVDEVVHASHKALLVNFLEPPDDASVEFRSGQRTIKPVLPFVSVDAAARGVGPDSVGIGYPRGTGTWPGSYLTSPQPGMHTIDGVRGRDVK